MPSMRQTPSRGCYGRLAIRGNQDEDDDEDGSPLDPEPNAVGRGRNLPSVTFVSQDANPSPGRCDAICKATKSAAIFCMTNIYISMLLIAISFALSLGPGLYCLLKLKPMMVIDKSIKAFNIPNHQVSRNQDALEKAHQDFRKGSRGKRDLRAYESAAYLPDYYFNSPQSIFVNKRDTRNTIDESPTFHGNKFLDVLLNDAHSQQTIRRIKRSDFEARLDGALRTLYSEDEQSHIEQTILQRSGRQKRNADKISGITQAVRRWKMQVVYLAEGPGEHNIFTNERLSTVHDIEKSIMEHAGFQDHCYINYRKADEDPNLGRYGGCAPLNSLLTYFYPSISPDGDVHYDGLGSNLDQINRTLKFAMTQDTFFWYVDDKINATYFNSRLLRTEVHFGAPLPGYRTISDRKDEQIRKFKKFIISYIDLLGKASTQDVRVLYGGNDIFDYEVDRTFWNDLTLAVYALVVIAIFMFVLTSGSVWLTFWGIISIILSFPLALFFYRKVFNIITLGILNGAAAFVIIGIGVDDVFVFVNTFRQAHHCKDLGERMWHMLLTAGKATFFTSFTTAAAFAANIASSIPAVHEFGLFMSLIVACCWLMVVLVMPPVINLWYRWFACTESACYGRCMRCPGPACLELPPDVTHFLETSKSDSGSNGSEASSSDLGYASGEQDDVPMLQIDKVNDHEGGWPIYLGMLNQMLYDDDDDDPLLQLENELISDLQNDDDNLTMEGCGLTMRFQAVLYYFVAKPIVKSRWIVFGMYFVILVISVGLMTQLKPATKPPQLFKEDTNLQRLMDLAANFSDSAITCDECSGFYKEKSVKYTPSPTAPSLTSPIVLPPDTLPDITIDDRNDNNVETPTSARKTTTPRPKPTTTKATTTTSSTTTSNPQKPTTTSTRTSTATTRRATNQQQTPKPTTAPITTPQPAAPTTKPVSTTTIEAESIGNDYDPCAGGKCNDIKARPSLELGAAIYVVFGIKDIDRSNVSYKHVLQEKGEVVYDEQFERAFSLKGYNRQALQNLCKLCKYIANNTELVRPNGSQCIPQYGLSPTIKHLLNTVPECKDLPENRLINGRRLPARAIAGLTDFGSLKWLAFAFESTTYKGQSYFTAYKEYQQWQQFIEHIKTDILPSNSPLQGLYQTSEFWKNVIMEIVAVSSAIYGLLLSMIICIATVAVFTGHILLLVIVCLTISGVICLVVAIFFVAGWEMGAVEAVSLSILVGSSVDYCVHLVEGYLLAGRNPPPGVATDNRSLRQWRTQVAISHIGISIASSAITTIIAAIPLTQTVIQPFSKFGQIVAINTTVSIFYTLTACVAFLSIFGPAKYVPNLKSTLQMTLGTGVAIAVFILSLFIASKFGVAIPAPNGDNLFHN